MAKVEVYSSNTCPYCVRAKSLLEAKGADYTEYNISTNPKVIVEMLERTNGLKSVPQIFIDGRHIGGCDDLHDLDSKGELELLLAS
ncbi:MAG: glutaredoxin 3 [Rhodospirillales bacterium]|nr:glutaredoxin 3 [Alphaproteobacteria bacterium]USO03004.1 MAG: glutaredoxin 3 [Rhodospirillales bacterium]